MNKDKTADIVIIGGGIIGTAIARELSKYQLKIILLEKDTDLSTGTTKGNSGILHAGFDPAPESFKGKTNARGNQLYHELEDDLSLEIRWTGSLVVAKNNEEIETLNKLLERGIANNVPDLKIISQEEVFKLEPNLSKDIKCALFAPSAGVIAPFNAAVSFAECAKQNGVEIVLNCEVQGFDIKDDKIYAVNTNMGKINTKYVINAAGLNADVISKLAGDESFTITPRKGEYLLFDSAVTNKLVKSIVFPTPTKMGKGILVCSTYHADVFIGPNAQDIQDKHDTGTSKEGINYIIETAKKILPELPLNAVITEFSGLRAISDTDDFIIGLSNKTQGLINVAGIQSPGLTSAPAIAEIVVEDIKNDGLKLEKKKDFKNKIPKKIYLNNLTDEEKALLIKENPLYGRIICRCETVSEGEIVDSINSICGAKTVDGVKRRVRAGLGRCQGGFCGPRIASILARELDIKITDVVKESQKSKLYYEKLSDEEVL